MILSCAKVYSHLMIIKRMERQYKSALNTNMTKQNVTLDFRLQTNR